MQEATEGRATTRVGNWDRPAHHQCIHIHESGERCNGSTATGKRLCHTHERFSTADPLYPIQVPLLEDPSSIRFVLSQAVRQLAMGAIPAANGRAVLYGCRMAFDLLKYEQAERRLQAQMGKKIAAMERMEGQPVRDLASQQVSEQASQPARSSASQLASESASEPVSDLASQPVSESASEPVRADSQTVSAPASQPVRSAAGTPGARESSTASPQNPAELPFVPSALWRDCPQPQACSLP